MPPANFKEVETMKNLAPALINKPLLDQMASVAQLGFMVGEQFRKGAYREVGDDSEDHTYGDKQSKEKTCVSTVALKLNGRGKFSQGRLEITPIPDHFTPFSQTRTRSRRASGRSL